MHTRPYLTETPQEMGLDIERNTTLVILFVINVAYNKKFEVAETP